MPPVNLFEDTSPDQLWQYPTNGCRQCGPATHDPSPRQISDDVIDNLMTLHNRFMHDCLYVEWVEFLSKAVVSDYSVIHIF